MEPSISFGNVLTILTMIIAVGSATWKLSLQISRMQWKMDLLWKWYKKEHKINGDENK